MPPGRLRLRQAPIPISAYASIVPTGCDSTFHRFRGFPSRRFRLAGPGLGYRPLTCFRFAAPCEVDDILRYGCYPCLVQAESEPPGRQARLLFLQRARCDFPQLSLLSIVRFHLAAPAGSPRPFTRFPFATPCEVGDILRYGCYPCLVRAESEPPGRRPPAPGSSSHRHYPVAGMTSDRVGSARLSPAFAASRLVAFTSRLPSVARGLTTLLSIA